MTDLKPFKLERYFAKYEFSVQYLLSSSDCDGLPQKELLQMADDETSQLWENLTLGYTESLGHPLLRAEIAGMYSGIKTEDCMVLVPEEGIFIAMNCILQKGDHVICTAPGYQSLYEVAQSIGCEVTQWQPEKEKGWWFDPDFLEEHVRENTRLLVINFPHNPTGYLPPKEDFQRMIDFARRHDLYLFSDEMYRYLEFNEADRLPSACEQYEKAVTLFGMSKTFGLAGARIGWLVTRDRELFKKMESFKSYTTICSSAPSEVLAIIGLRARNRIIERHLTRIERNLGLLDQFFEDYRDRFEWVRPKAGTIAFPRLKGAEGAFDFCQRVVAEAGIMLLPSTVYDYDDSHIRIGFGRENMPEALAKLREWLGGE